MRPVACLRLNDETTLSDFIAATLQALRTILASTPSVALVSEPCPPAVPPTVSVVGPSRLTFTQRIVVFGFQAGEPLLQRSAMSPDLVAGLEQLNTALKEDYALRQRMLLQRLDLTIQSFLWSDKAKARFATLLPPT
jgi:Protein of unknown function (DUF2465)